MREGAIPSRVPTMASVERETPMLGQILVRRKIVDASVIERASQAQGASLLPIGSTLIRANLASERDVTAALAEQFGVPGVVLTKTIIPTKLLAVLPREVASSHGILPVGEVGGALALAVSNPKHQALLDEIAFASGRAVLPHVAPRAMLNDAIAAAYAARDAGEAFAKGLEAEGAEAHLEVVTAPLDDVDDGMEPELSHSALDAFPAMPVQKAPRPAREKPVVLAVDDEPEILDIIQKALSHRGLEVVTASRGRQALEQLREHDPDIVLLDAMLPEIHGFEICSQIKKSEQYGHVPVIIISAIYTGWNFIQDVKRIYGADEYVTKPFRVMELVHKVEEVLAKVQGGPTPPDKAEAHRRAHEEVEKAGLAAKSGDLERMLEHANTAVRADPFDARAHFVLGTALHRAGKIYEAISEYERVVELAPGQFSALKNLAVLYERQGFKAKAVELWMRALEASPSSAVRKTIKAHLIGLL